MQSETIQIREGHRRILRTAYRLACEGRLPTTSKALLREAGYTLSSYGRGLLTDLYHAGHLVRIRGGGVVVSATAPHC